MWAALVLFVSSFVSAEYRVDTTSRNHPLVDAVFVDTPPVIDGRLDDPVWAEAARLSDFYVPDLDRLPTERTIVWLAYDDTHLYLAARCFDERPDLLRMEQTRRGGSVGADDYIAFSFDLHRKLTSSSEHAFRVTPRGVQNETIPHGAAAKVEWRGDWQAAAVVDSLGWTVEVAIPFTFFDLPQGERSIALSVYRWHPRTQEAIRWPNTGDTWDRTMMADWTGIQWPAVRRFPYVMPYVVGEWEDSGADAYMGVDVKHTTASGFTYVGTLYPDFQNVENEILGLDFSYTEQVRGDNRPFFTEGSAYLPKNWIFYSNRVGEIYGGAKVFGQRGRHGFGMVQAYDHDEVNHMAGKWEWVPADRVQIETSFVWRYGPEEAVNTAYGPAVRSNFMAVNEIVAGRVVGRGSESFRIQTGISESSGSEADGWNIEGSWRRDGGNREPGWSLRGRHLSKGFVTLDGSYDYIDANQRDVAVDLWYNIRYDRTWFRSFGVSTDNRYAQRLNGDLYVRTHSVGGDMELLPGTSVSVRYRDMERPPYHDQTVQAALSWNTHRLYTTGRAGAQYGRVKDGDFLHTWIEQGFHPLPRFNTRLRVQWRRHDLPAGHEDRPEGGVDSRY